MVLLPRHEYLSETSLAHLAEVRQCLPVFQCSGPTERNVPVVDRSESRSICKYIPAQAMFTCCLLTGTDDKVLNSEEEESVLAEAVFQLNTCMDATVFPH